MKNKVLITGAAGQLGQCIKDLQSYYIDIEFYFTDVEDLDISNEQNVLDFFQTNQIRWCVNCAAYTAVDKAESDEKMAYDINAIGAKNLALACRVHHAKLIHISTDFVFDGSQSVPYSEEAQTNPLGVYGDSKLQGELEIQAKLKEHFIIRTSWLYSEYGQNFLKTMLKLGEDREALNVVGDQVGTPTYAGDLAIVLLDIIKNNTEQYGIYHFSNEGVASWYDFAKAIFDIQGNDRIKVGNILSEAYPTPAKRPSFSVLDKAKIKKQMNIEIPYWRDSLYKVINQIK
ncbi:dTDP-4-dehydrorhamnose reductase [Mangrovimonas sp. AS39]|uniref:dTDP-4-dehydrorhamnose reductase n=1 Tax=Mangrovimonas futianensis TaxID=2895523 RepID=UPI001E29FB07|nr:dTDP-4-dehydrorhamnose reductase [Mangrovimonas futianensis]MCF1190330.1 dTDP-4-dehydrorhamnose reductase [Mangrovimonas futianensis]MCF1193917.1 dTDP-4-dehydrorhamnose reductase [Mangrovimonas futianensis]